MVTIQSGSAWDTLTRQGLLRSDPQRAPGEFVEPYGWMSEQMHRRLADDDDGSVIWFWARASARVLRHDIRHAPRGSVLIVGEIDRSRLLLSDFGDWHQVLNRQLNTPRFDSEPVETWWPRAEAALDDFRLLTSRAHVADQPLRFWPDDLREMLTTSWEYIFDQRTWQCDEPIQATARELRITDVVRAFRLG